MTPTHLQPTICGFSSITPNLQKVKPSYLFFTDIIKIYFHFARFPFTISVESARIKVSGIRQNNKSGMTENLRHAERRVLRMKKLRHLTVTIVALMTAAILLCGCGTDLFKAEPKEFSKAGMTITLSDKFYEKDMVNYTAYYESQKVGVTALKEEFTLFEQAGYDCGELSIKDYIGFVIQANELPTDTEITEENGLTSFTYEKTASGNDFKYFAAAYKTGDAFWLFNFYCERDDFDGFLPRFQEWAGSVTFTADQK